MIDFKDINIAKTTLFSNYMLLLPVVFIMGFAIQIFEWVILPAIKHFSPRFAFPGKA